MDPCLDIGSAQVPVHDGGLRLGAAGSPGDEALCLYRRPVQRNSHSAHDGMEAHQNGVSGERPGGRLNEIWKRAGVLTGSRGQGGPLAPPIDESGAPVC
ncbi:hypothetical protein SKAU_G00252430 [Synaphobranchus kaupii]|uniref:Uncharacterized protein n=1 Tax=Synaphobranchus kaupii TaxID=118154 RepID=A0A9Q1F340_SYNKA|nr:hypothetical protein SKAU_G00252430 [Synaphobranchus kaupii]